MNREKLSCLGLSIQDDLADKQWQNCQQLSTTNNGRIVNDMANWQWTEFDHTFGYFITQPGITTATFLETAGWLQLFSGKVCENCVFVYSVSVSSYTTLSRCHRPCAFSGIVCGRFASTQNLWQWSRLVIYNEIVDHC